MISKVEAKILAKDLYDTRNGVAIATLVKKLRDDYQVKQSEDLRVAGLDRVQAYPFESRDGDYGALCLFTTDLHWEVNAFSQNVVSALYACKMIDDNLGANQESIQCLDALTHAMLTSLQDEPSLFFDRSQYLRDCLHLNSHQVGCAQAIETAFLTPLQDLPCIDPYDIQMNDCDGESQSDDLEEENVSTIQTDTQAIESVSSAIAQSFDQDMQTSAYIDIDVILQSLPAKDLSSTAFFARASPKKKSQPPTNHKHTMS